MPCRAAKGLECVFPIWFTQCGRVWFTLAMPLPCHPRAAVLLKDTAQHGRRQTACGLLAHVRLLPATTRNSTKLLSDAYQSQMQLACVKPNTVCMDEEKSGSNTLQEDDLLHCWTSSSYISVYHADFHEGHGTIGAGQGRCMACVK